MTNKKVRLGVSDDYAIIYSDDLIFYYGYEYTEKTGSQDDWMFVVKKNGNIVKHYTTSFLEDNSSKNINNVEDYLMLGMFLFIQGVDSSNSEPISYSDRQLEY